MEVSLDYLMSYWKTRDKDAEGYLNAGTFITSLIKQLQTEMELNNQKKPISKAAMQFKQMLNFTQSTIYACDEQHITESKHKNYYLPVLKLPSTESLEKSLEKGLEIELIQRKCQECNNGELVDSLCNKQLSSAPQILIICFDIFKKNGKVMDKTQFVKSVPRKFDLSSIFPQFSLADDEPDASYDLMGLVDLDGESLQKSNYTAYVKRKSQKNEGKIQWYGICKDKKWLVQLDFVLNQTKPQILFYQRK